MDKKITLWDIPYRNHLSKSNIINIHNRSQYETTMGYNESNYSLNKYTGPIMESVLQYQFKPNGFWYSISDAWLKWQREDEIIYEYDLGTRYLYEVVIFSDKFTGVMNPDPNKLLVLLPDDVKLFEAVYKLNSEYSGFLGTIDWLRVSKDFAGLEIPIYNDELRFGYKFLYPWDVASGCIWNISVIKEVNLII
jgi:hypothetical protein